MIQIHNALFNIIVAIFLGVFLDKSVNKLFVGKSEFIRIVVQILFIILIVHGLDTIYGNVLNIKIVTESVFFISVFLGVQKSLWDTVYDLGNLKIVKN